MSEAESESELDASDAGDASVAVLGIEVGGTLLGVPVAHVLEIGETPLVTAIPMAPPHVLGLVNWRGRPVPLVSLERFAGLVAEGATADVQPRMIVLRVSSMTVALRCDRVRGVLEVAKAASSADLSVGTLEGLVSAQVDFGEELMLVFDVAAFLEASRLRA